MLTSFEIADHEQKSSFTRLLVGDPQTIAACNSVGYHRSAIHVAAGDLYQEKVDGRDIGT